jgi:hypothetical protein
MKRIILTISEARQLQQRGNQPLPSYYAKQMAIQTPELPHGEYDDQRLLVASEMIEHGCSEEQLLTQMNWKVIGLTVRELMKLHKARKRV